MIKTISIKTSFQIVQCFIFFQVPIIPDYLFELDHPNEKAELANLFSIANMTLLTDEEYLSRYPEHSLLSKKLFNFVSTF